MLHRYQYTIHLVASLPFTYKIPFTVIVSFFSNFDFFSSALLILESCYFSIISILRLFIIVHIFCSCCVMNI